MTMEGGWGGIKRSNGGILKHSNGSRLANHSSTHSPLPARQGHQETSRRFRGRLGTTSQPRLHSARPRLLRAFQLCAGALPHATGETIPRSLAPLFLSTHPTPAVDDGLAPGQTTPPVPGGGRRGPREAILGLSFRSRLPARARRSLQKPNPAGPALTCHAATATAASILGLSSCFLAESASTAPRTFTIGSAGFSPPSLLG